MRDGILNEIASAFGMQAAIQVARVYGGDNLRVPASIYAGHPLAVALGFDLAKAFCSRFCDREFYVPSERTALIAARNAAIVAAHKADVSVSRIAVDNRISRRMVRKILEKAGR